ncbi:MAG: response regulator [Desulfotignum sp.]|nr:response regulator [Desulfotignum sp.]MCF8139064.1 response regulator [Desulfotignum sp.]
MEKKIQVLIVDDEVRFARNVSRLLDTGPFDVSVAHNGLDALDVVHKTRPDVVVLDIRMPEMDGIETLLAMKNLDPEIQVIILTGHADVETGILAIRDGAFDYLFKPCDMELLKEKILQAATAKQIQHRPVLWPRRMVKEITNASFIPLDITDDLKKALEILTAMGDGGIREELHVTDNKDRLRGVVSRNELIREAEKGGPERHTVWSDLAQNPGWLPDKKVSDVMKPPAGISAHPDDPLHQVAQKMIDNHLRCLPVMADNRFMGIIRLNDILFHISLGHENRKQGYEDA